MDDQKRKNLAKNLITFKELNSIDTAADLDPNYDPDGTLARQHLKRKKSSGSEGGPIGESTEEVDEALSKAGRRALAKSAKRNAKKNARKRELSMKKKASPEKIKARAMKAARNTMKKKLLKGKDPSEVTPDILANIEKKLDKMKGKIAKLAKKLLPQIKKKEQERLSGGSEE